MSFVRVSARAMDFIEALLMSTIRSKAFTFKEVMKPKFNTCQRIPEGQGLLLLEYFIKKQVLSLQKLPAVSCKLLYLTEYGPIFFQEISNSCKAFRTSSIISLG